MARRLIFEYALHQDPQSGELSSYWPEHWPVERLLDEYQSLTSVFFAASYQNDPSALDGNLLSIDWLSYYLPSELEIARREAGIREGQRGTMYAGVDPALGGTDGSADNCAVIVGERIGNLLYLVGLLSKRMRIELQAQEIESYLDLWMPNFTVVEDIAKRGYVWRDMQTQINNGEGTKHHVTIETPQSRSASGNKEQRFLTMAPRFARTQIRVPGYIDPHATNTRESGQISCHPDWVPFLEQWRAFPAGHDDILDAAYWCQYKAFEVEPAASTSKQAPSDRYLSGYTSSDIIPDPDTTVCGSQAHSGYGGVMSQCNRCMIWYEERVNQFKADRARHEDPPQRTIGAQRQRPGGGRLSDRAARRSPRGSVWG